MKVRFEIFKKSRLLRSPRWYWRLVAANNEIIAIGTEPFDSQANTKRAIKAVRQYAAQADIELSEN